MKIKQSKFSNLYIKEIKKDIYIINISYLKDSHIIMSKIDIQKLKERIKHLDNTYDDFKKCIRQIRK